MLLAVYGTLRKGMPNHHMLRGSELVWEGYIEIPYKLVVCSYIPFLVRCEEKRRIYVEVYRVDEELLGILDEFEDVPELYERIEIETPVGRAWIYVASKEMECEEVVDGDYATFLRKLRSYVSYEA